MSSARSENNRNEDNVSSTESITAAHGTPWLRLEVAWERHRLGEEILRISIVGKGFLSIL